jgi:hypothetical protein
MAFKISGRTPNKFSSAEELADYAEYLALIKNQISIHDIFKEIELISDEIEVDGIIDETDEINVKEEEVIAEIENRINLCQGKYPFELSLVGHSFKFIEQLSCQGHVLYIYLLLSTRLNMQTDRVHSGIDGTKLFENLSAIIVQSYFGIKSKSFVFGTGISGGFEIKLKDLISKIGEGGTPKSYSSARPKDDKLDIVIWNNFYDKKRSKLIVFGQCKTGTDWIENSPELDADNFCKTWFSSYPLVNPIKIFVCSNYFPRDKWDHKGYAYGIIFDRFRLIDCLQELLPEPIFNETKKWVDGGLEFIKRTII